MDYRNLQREQLEEISRSDWLAEDFADHIQEDFLISAPPDLKSSVIRRYAQPEAYQVLADTDVQLAAGARSLSRRTRLLLYSLKVGAAVAASVLLLALLPATFPPGGGPGASVPFYQKAQQITHGLNRITYNFTDWEVFFNDKEKE